MEKQEGFYWARRDPAYDFPEFNHKQERMVLVRVDETGMYIQTQAGELQTFVMEIVKPANLTAY